MPDRIENGRLIFEDDEPADLQPEITLADVLVALAAAQAPPKGKPVRIPWAITYDADLNPISYSVPLEDIAAHPKQYEMPAMLIEITDDDVQELLRASPSALRYWKNTSHASALRS